MDDLTNNCTGFVHQRGYVHTRIIDHGTNSKALGHNLFILWNNRDVYGTVSHEYVHTLQANEALGELLRFGSIWFKEGSAEALSRIWLDWPPQFDEQDTPLVELELDLPVSSKTVVGDQTVAGLMLLWNIREVLGHAIFGKILQGLYQRRDFVSGSECAAVFKRSARSRAGQIEEIFRRRIAGYVAGSL
ncbi:MAG: hypothetical protein ACKVVT_08300 [Dehalococcoidia bacterium]